uniref:Uncharacterized protein n=1 Tax=Rhizophora mucronata TaxID=61149 RepID=A0A2P2R497_RHIMU
MISWRIKKQVFLLNMYILRASLAQIQN